MRSISGKAALVGVIGCPVSHSKSPQMHNQWLEKQAIDALYMPLTISKDDVIEQIKAMRRFGFHGWNVTIPHKEVMLDVADEITDEVKMIGAANTMILRDGTLEAHNTDAFGFIRALDECYPEWNDEAENVLVLGAGGASRAALYALRQRGLTIYVSNRTEEKAQRLADEFGDLVQRVPWEEKQNILADMDLLVNTTSLGMKGAEPIDMDFNVCKPNAVVYDIIYAPAETSWLKKAREHGLKTLNGAAMLAWQGAKAFELWFGVLPDVDDALIAMIEGQ